MFGWTVANHAVSTVRVDGNTLGLEPEVDDEAHGRWANGSEKLHDSPALTTIWNAEACSASSKYLGVARGIPRLAVTARYPISERRKF